MGAEASVPLVVGGLFVNHLLAKAGLFWLAGALRLGDIDAGAGFARHPVRVALLGALIVAIAGLPPFPGFFAKWELVMQLAGGGRPAWIVVILAGSLLEAAYMFNWFIRLLRPGEGERAAAADPATLGWVALLPVLAVVVLLLVAGHAAATAAGAGSAWMFAPLAVGFLLFLGDGLPGRAKGAAMLVAVLLVGAWLTRDSGGIARLFAVLLLAGGLVIAAASLYRPDRRPGFYPMLAALLLSTAALLRSATSLEFFYSWEIISLACCFLIARGRSGGPAALTFLLFSLLSAYFLLAGFASAVAVGGTTELAALGRSGPDASLAFVLLAIGFLVKAGAVGTHVWLPDAYAEAEDDFTAMLSGVVSKVAIFGLFTGTYLAIRSEVGLELAHVMAWVGMLTTIAGALMALWQTDFKRLLAFSSMSQLGYIVTAIALMSHLGWVTALYLVANHMMVKGILFLALAGIILRTGTRAFGETGGLAARHAGDLRHRAGRHRLHVGPAAADGLRRQVAAAQRHDRQGLVCPGDRRRGSHLPRLPLHDPHRRRSVPRRAEARPATMSPRRQLCCSRRSSCLSPGSSCSPSSRSC